VSKSLERRIAQLEETRRLARERAAWRSMTGQEEPPTEYFQRLRVRLSELEATTEERIDAVTRELAALDADIKRPRSAGADLREQRQLEYCRRHCEIDLLGLKGEISPEQVWAAREQASHSVRRGAPFAPIPTHEQAVELIESGAIGCRSFMPAELEERYSRPPVGPTLDVAIEDGSVADDPYPD